MKRLSLLITTLLLLIPAKVFAHVLVTDTTGESGMIVHITPDDDPIAGQPAHFFFDLSEAGLTTDIYGFVFEVANEEGLRDSVIASPAGSTSVSLAYTFPSRGTYKLELIASPRQYGSSKLGKTFSFSQLVSRGVTDSPLDQPRYALAEFAFVAGMAGLGILVLAIISRRKQIAAYTKKL